MSFYANRGRHFRAPSQSVAAFLLTLLLVAFLVLMRILDASRVPEETIRMVELTPELAMPAPPPPPPAAQTFAEPAPPPRVELPQLDIQMDQLAPALKARIDPRMDLTMETAMFELEVDPPSPPKIQHQAAPRPRVSEPAPPRRQVNRPAPRSRPGPPAPAPRPAPRTTYDAGELDGKPRLLRVPSSSFPGDLLKQGVREGRVVVEVQIDTRGRVSVRRILSSNHPRFSKMARSVAARSRFTTPTKNGRAVNAIFRWPLVFRP